MSNRRNISAIFRVIAGGYLIYLGVRLFRDGVLSGEMVGSHKFLGILFSVLFVVFGIVFAVHAIRWMAQNSEEEEETEEIEGEEIVEAKEAAEEKEPGAAPSLFERAMRFSNAAEDDEEEMEEADEEVEDVDGSVEEIGVFAEAAADVVAEEYAEDVTEE